MGVHCIALHCTLCNAHCALCKLTVMCGVRLYQLHCYRHCPMDGHSYQYWALCNADDGDQLLSRVQLEGLFDFDR